MKLLVMIVLGGFFCGIQAGELPSLPSLPSLSMPSLSSSGSSTLDSDSHTSSSSVKKPAASESADTKKAAASDKSEKIVVGVKNVHQVALDTLNIDSGGNWLEKRIWYEKAEQLFDMIRGIVNQVVDFRIHFSNEVNAVGQKIDSFYEVVSFDKGQIDEMLKDLLEDLHEQQQDRGDLSLQERELKQKVKKDQATLEQIGKDIKVISDIDAKIDQTLIRAFKTIDQCRDYESKSWKNFKEIGRALDDKKARNLYYEIENFKKNIDTLQHFLQATLLPYLQHTLVANVDEHIAKIKSNMSSLKAKGIDLEKLMKSYQDADEKVEKQRELESKEIAVKEAVDKVQEQEKERFAVEKAKAKKALEETWSYKVHGALQSVVCYLDFLYCSFVSALSSVGCSISQGFCKIKCWMCGLVGK